MQVISAARMVNHCRGLSLAIAVLLASALPSIASSTTSKMHPIHLDPDTKSSACLDCHANLKEGKYVHAAMEMGCTTCHSIQERKNETSVTLVSPSDQLCFMCHQKSSDPVLHSPYAEGACTVCHSPHSSNFPAHTLAAHQDLCMGCHVRGFAKVNEKKKTVTVPWGATLTFHEFKGWYYIGLNPAHTANHPVMGHPVTGPNTLLAKSAPDISCLSCHKAHASTRTNLRPPQFANQTDLCLSCHTSL